jgi:Homeo-prospero domain
MEKYARQAITEGVKSAEEIHVALDSEIYRVLNLHYNRNNHIEVWGPQVRISLQPTYLNIFLYIYIQCALSYYYIFKLPFLSIDQIFIIII